MVSRDSIQRLTVIVGQPYRSRLIQRMQTVTEPSIDRIDPVVIGETIAGERLTAPTIDRGQSTKSGCMIERTGFAE